MKIPHFHARLLILTFFLNVTGKIKFTSRCPHKRIRGCKLPRDYFCLNDFCLHLPISSMNMERVGGTRLFIQGPLLTQNASCWCWKNSRHSHTHTQAHSLSSQTCVRKWFHKAFLFQLIHVKTCGNTKPTLSLQSRQPQLFDHTHAEGDAAKSPW